MKRVAYFYNEEKSEQLLKLQVDGKKSNKKPDLGRATG
jgi:hypothetical protein